MQQNRIGDMQSGADGIPLFKKKKRKEKHQKIALFCLVHQVARLSLKEDNLGNVGLSKCIRPTWLSHLHSPRFVFSYYLAKKMVVSGEFHLLLAFKRRNLAIWLFDFKILQVPSLTRWWPTISAYLYTSVLEVFRKH